MSKQNPYTKFRRILHLFQLIIIIAVLIFVYNFLPISKDANKTFYLDAFNKQSIVTDLEAQGYTLTFLDKIMLDSETLPTKGWYTLKDEGQGRYAFFKHLYKHKAKTMNIVIYAGETHTEIMHRLANDVKLEKKALLQYYKKYALFKEASIFAGHYKIARDVKEETLIRYLLHDSQKVLDLFIEKSFSNPPDALEVKILLTIASIIQKESNAIAEMPTISAVIYNRLKKKMRLQMDSTLNYGKFSHTIVTPERIKNDTSYYNTYKHKGLPPHPLASISIDALRAAMFPEACDHLFFMLQPDGKHVFCESYDEHLENIRVFRAYQKKRAEEKRVAAEKLAAEKEAKKKKLAEKKSADKKSVNKKQAVKTVSQKKAIPSIKKDANMSEENNKTSEQNSSK